MNVIGIETSGSVGSVALLRERELVEEKLFGENFEHGRDLVPCLDWLLNSHGLSPRAIDLYAVGIGPGSYTGLRVGVATAKALAYASGAAVVGVPTMEALVRNVGGTADEACAMLDAKRGELYVQPFRSMRDTWEPLFPPRVLGPEAAAADIDAGILLLGDGLEAYGAFFQQKGFPLAPRELWRPRAEFIARLGADLFGQEGRQDPHSLVPIYLRRPAAEEKRLQRR